MKYMRPLCNAVGVFVCYKSSVLCFAQLIVLQSGGRFDPHAYEFEH